MACKLRVLYVEDSELDRDLFLRDISKEVVSGYLEVDWRASLEECRADNECDVILLDLNLPHTRGVDTVRACRKIYPHKPIIVLTGRDDSEVKSDVVKAGANGCFSKHSQSGLVVLQSIEEALLSQISNEEREASDTMKHHRESLSKVRKTLEGIIHRLT